MPLRIIQDQQGRTWQVWGVQPTDINGPIGDPAAGQPVEAQRPRRVTAVDPQWADGWLTFETQGEKRRLAPYPSNWTGLSDQELTALCAKALLVQPSRARSAWI